MANITLTFQFELNSLLRKEEAARYKYMKSVVDDIASEMEISPSDLDVKWNLDVTGHFLLLRIYIPEEDARFLEVALHNLHQAKLLN